MLANEPEFSNEERQEFVDIINKENAEKIGIKIPEDLLKAAESSK